MVCIPLAVTSEYMGLVITEYGLHTGTRLEHTPVSVRLILYKDVFSGDLNSFILVSKVRIGFVLRKEKNSTGFVFLILYGLRNLAKFLWP